MSAIPQPKGFFTPDPISDECREYLRIHRVDYSGPGEYENIRQYEEFGGAVNAVHVHPSFPAEPVVTHDGWYGTGFHRHQGRIIWCTSSRREAVKLAKIQRSKPEYASYEHAAEIVKRICDAAEVVIAFFAEFMNEGKLDRKAQNYEARAREVYNTLAWDHESPFLPGSIIWPDVCSAMSAIAFVGAPDYRVVDWSRKLANRIACKLRRLGDQGLVVNRAVTALGDRLSEVTGQR